MVVVVEGAGTPFGVFSRSRRPRRRGQGDAGPPTLPLELDSLPDSVSGSE